jgi:hypothetical protein
LGPLQISVMKNAATFRPASSDGTTAVRPVPEVFRGGGNGISPVGGLRSTSSGTDIRCSGEGSWIS